MTMKERGASWLKAGVHATMVLVIVAIGVAAFLLFGMWVLIDWLNPN
jgi:hypothetical protein